MYNLRAAIRKNYGSLKNFSEATGFSIALLSKWQTGVSPISPKQQRYLTSLLGEIEFPDQPLWKEKYLAKCEEYKHLESELQRVYKAYDASLAVLKKISTLVDEARV